MPTPPDSAGPYTTTRRPSTWERGTSLASTQQAASKQPPLNFLTWRATCRGLDSARPWPAHPRRREALRCPGAPPQAAGENVSKRWSAGAWLFTEIARSGERVLRLKSPSGQRVFGSGAPQNLQGVAGATQSCPAMHPHISMGNTNRWGDGAMGSIWFFSRWLHWRGPSF